MNTIINFLIGAFVFIDCPEMFFAVEQKEHELDAVYFSNGHLNSI